MSEPTVPPAKKTPSKQTDAAAKALADAEAAAEKAAAASAATREATEKGADSATKKATETADSAKEAVADAKATAAKATETAGAAAPATPPAQAPIFVQAPEQPKQKGNRFTAVWVGLMATVVFGVLFLIASMIVDAFSGAAVDIAESISTAFGSWVFWMPVITFFLGFWILGALINRGRWGLWVLFGLFVGLAAYGGLLLGVLVDNEFWTLSGDQAGMVVQSLLLSAPALVVLIIGREVTIWFGALMSKIGHRKTEQNAAAKKEYEAKLAAGPVLTR
jgi:hypothetical protein